MLRLLVASTVLIATACSSKEPAPTAAKPEASKPAGGFALGEATVIELLDKRRQPVSRPTWKLHADGKTERANDTGEWRPELEARPDGTIWLGDQQLATVTPTAITYAIPDGPKPIAIDGDTLSLVVWEKARDGEDYTAKIDLASDGTITVHHRDGSRKQWRIEAADPAVMRTAFRVFALSMKAALD